MYFSSIEHTENNEENSSSFILPKDFKLLMKLFFWSEDRENDNTFFKSFSTKLVCFFPLIFALIYNLMQ